MKVDMIVKKQFRSIDLLIYNGTSNVTILIFAEDVRDEDPDQLQREMIDNILERELNRTSDTIVSSPERKDTKKSSVYWDME